MSKTDADKKAEMPELDLWWIGRNPGSRESTSAPKLTAGTEKETATGGATMEAVVARENMLRAMKAVEKNAGAPGVDGMTTGQMRHYLRAHWEQIKRQLLGGSYEPQAVRRVDIPKPGGGTRMLGIPTVIDRLIQQALHQVMSPQWEPGFSENSYGFRPGRSAHQAVEAARGHIASGRNWVVDIDLEKFFDRVNHDVLMARVARRVSDKRMLGLIRRYLRSGIMAGGLTQQRSEGTPQGGPLSPLLSNILLDDLDKELERRGHCFCRYADDCNVYVRSERAGKRVMESLRDFLTRKLRLKINESKSRVERPWKTKFLGYSTLEQSQETRLIVADESIKRLKVEVRVLFRQARGRNLQWFIREELNPLLRGWANYYRKSVEGTFKTLDQWIRRKLRCLIWRQWMRPYTRAHRLMRAGYTAIRAWDCARNGRGPWRNAASRHMSHACPNAAFEQMGLVSMLATVRCHA